MPSNPSGTDMNTVQEEGNDTNHFVSLIVNNAGQYHACVTRKIIKTIKVSTTGNQTLSYSTFGGRKINKEAPISTNTDDIITCIEYYPLDITIESDNTDWSELDQRIDFLWKSPDSYVNSHGNSWTKPTQIDEHTIIAPPPTVPDTIANRKAQREPTLFDGQPDNPFKEAEDKIPMVKLPESIIEESIKQIISGSIFSIFNSKFNITQWAENMGNVYLKRFGAIEETESTGNIFYNWADSFLDFLAEDVLTKDFGDEISNELALFDDDYIEDAIKSSWAESLMDWLGEFPENPYLNYFITELGQYITI